MSEEFRNERREKYVCVRRCPFCSAYHCRMFLYKQLLNRTSEMSLIEKAKDRLE